MSVHVFLGPTLSLDDAREYLDATYHPPVQQGDILRVMAEDPSVIGIVDGYFERVPSVWHKEILLALRRGIQVFGAASMGALRAAELHRFGMVGVGRVFEWFRTGELEDDDEVAVVHAPADVNFMPLSEAMVNIRDSLQAAIADGVISAGVAADLIAIAKALHYPQRSYGRVMKLARDRGTDAAQLRRLSAFLETYRPCLKERDAIAMLQRVAMAASDPLAPRASDFEVEQTVFLTALMHEVGYVGLDSSGRLNADATPEPMGETPEVARKKVLLRLLARREATRLGIEAAVDEIQVASDSFRAAFGLTTAEATDAWLRSAGLTREAFHELMRDAALLEKLEQRYAGEVGRAMPDQTRLSTVRLWSRGWPVG